MAKPGSASVGSPGSAGNAGNAGKLGRAGNAGIGIANPGIGSSGKAQRLTPPSR